MSYWKVAKKILKMLENLIGNTRLEINSFGKSRIGKSGPILFNDWEKIEENVGNKEKRFFFLTMHIRSTYSKSDEESKHWKTSQTHSFRFYENICSEVFSLHMSSSGSFAVIPSGMTR